MCMQHALLEAQASSQTCALEPTLIDACAVYNAVRQALAMCPAHSTAHPALCGASPIAYAEQVAAAVCRQRGGAGVQVLRALLPRLALCPHPPGARAAVRSQGLTVVLGVLAVPGCPAGTLMTDVHA